MPFDKLLDFLAIASFVCAALAFLFRKQNEMAIMLYRLNDLHNDVNNLAAKIREIENRL